MIFSKFVNNLSNFRDLIIHSINNLERELLINHGTLASAIGWFVPNPRVHPTHSGSNIDLQKSELQPQTTLGG